MGIQLDALVNLAWAQIAQLTAVAVVAGVLARLVGPRRPHLAYVLWLLVIVKCVTPPLWSSPTGVFSWLGHPRTVSGSHDSGAELPAIVNSPARAPVSTPTASSAAATPAPAAHAGAATGSVAPAAQSATAVAPDAASKLPPKRHGQAFPIGTLLVVVWLGGTLAYLSFVIAKMLWWQRVIRRSRTRNDGPLLEMVARLSARLGLRRKVRVLVTSRPLGPASLGILRPAVLLPQVLTNRSTHQIESIVAHELIHVRRHDVAVGAVQILAQGLWWFHPLIWWANRALCRERERCCDAEVVGSLGCPRQQYAQGLLDVLRLQRQLVTASALSGLNPFQVTQIRLATVMNPDIQAHRRTPWGYWLVFVTGLLVALPGAVVTGSSQKAPVAGHTSGSEVESRRTAVAPDAHLSVATIQGSWRVESLEQAQGRQEAEVVPQTLSIDEATIVMRRGRQFIAETPYRLDAGQSPPTIQFGFDGEPMHGICQHAGDRLTICLTAAKAALPKKFQLGPQDGQVLLVLRSAADQVRPLYLMDVDGKNLRPLVSMPEYTLTGSPRWSPDGKRIAFDACRPGAEEDFNPSSHVFVANADGTEIRDLGDGGMPSWSGDGKRIALSRYGVNRGIWIMNADGSRAQLLDEKAWAVAWSPTASRVAYTVDEGGVPNIRVRDLDQPDGRTLLTRSYAQIQYRFWRSLCWSPDGQWIAFKAITSDNQAELAMVHVEGQAKGFKVILRDPRIDDAFSGTVSWTSDGRRLLVSMIPTSGATRRLHFVDVKGQRPPQLVPGPNPAWSIPGMDLSPDGKQILFNYFVPAPLAMPEGTVSQSVVHFAS